MSSRRDLRLKLRCKDNDELAIACCITLEELLQRIPEEESPRDFSGSYSSAPKSLRFQILARDNFHCRYCGRGVEDGIKLQVDHIVSRNSGGETIATNLITACFDCNRGKSKRTLLVSGGQIPSFIAVGRS
jgi:5-methylcytosine-specific restriction endonuclease McrA